MENAKTGYLDQSERAVAGVACCFGVFSAFMFLGAVGERLDDLFVDRGSPFNTLILIVAATLAAATSRGVGLGVGLLALVFSWFGTTYASTDDGMLNLSLAALVVFWLLLAASLWLTHVRQRDASAEAFYKKKAKQQYRRAKEHTA